jgi:hypothetical protein
MTEVEYYDVYNQRLNPNTFSGACWLWDYDRIRLYMPTVSLYSEIRDGIRYLKSSDYAHKTPEKLIAIVQVILDTYDYTDLATDIFSTLCNHIHSLYGPALKYIHDRYPKLDISAALNEACMYGHYELVEMFLSWTTPSTYILDNALVMSVHNYHADPRIIHLLIARGARTISKAFDHSTRYASYSATAALMQYYPQLSHHCIVQGLRKMASHGDRDIARIIDACDLTKIYIPKPQLIQICNNHTTLNIFTRNIKKFVTGSQNAIRQLAWRYEQVHAHLCDVGIIPVVVSIVMDYSI